MRAALNCWSRPSPVENCMDALFPEIAPLGALLPALSLRELPENSPEAFLSLLELPETSPEPVLSLLQLPRKP